MTCRDEILNSVREIIKAKGKNEFTAAEVIRAMQTKGTKFEASTIRTHISSKLCADAPDNHGKTYNDFERVGHGLYKRKNCSF